MHVETSAEPDLSGHWDPDVRERVIANLVSNALKFPPDEPIRASVTPTLDSVKLSVNDHGIGISGACQKPGRSGRGLKRVLSSYRPSGLDRGAPWLSSDGVKVRYSRTSTNTILVVGVLENHAAGVNVPGVASGTAARPYLKSSVRSVRDVLRGVCDW